MDNGVLALNDTLVRIMEPKGSLHWEWPRLTCRWRRDTQHSCQRTRENRFEPTKEWTRGCTKSSSHQWGEAHMRNMIYIEAIIRCYALLLSVSGISLGISSEVNLRNSHWRHYHINSLRLPSSRYCWSSTCAKSRLIYVLRLAFLQNEYPFHLLNCLQPGVLMISIW